MKHFFYFCKRKKKSELTPNEEMLLRNVFGKMHLSPQKVTAICQDIYKHQMKGETK